MVLAVPHHHHPTTAGAVPPYDEDGDGGDRAPLLMMSSSKSYTRALSCDRLRKVEEWVWSLQKTNTKNSTKPNKKTEAATDFLIISSGGRGDDESSSESSSSPLIDLIDLVNSTKPRSSTPPPPPPCLLPRNNRVQQPLQQHNKTSSSSPLLLSPRPPPPPPTRPPVVEDVDVGQCGWFWGTSASMESLHSLLSSCGIGTFLLRSSSHPLYRYTLSVQTSRGPTSVRIVRSTATATATAAPSSSSPVYSLDSADSRLPLPRFPSVVALVQYYVNEHHHHQSSQQKKKVKLTPPDQQQQQQQVVWVESGSGRTHSRVVLSQPLLTNPHSLKHAARLAVNRLQQQSSSLNSSFTIPTSLVKYIHTYPFTI